MNRIAAKAIGLTVLFFLSTSLSALAPSIALDPVHDVRSSNTGTGGAVDVPTYRIGDEWVYETKFDIALSLRRPTYLRRLMHSQEIRGTRWSDIFYAHRQQR